MKETRMIKVIGTQRNIEGEENTIELMTQGTFYKKNDKYYIVYEESEISGLEGATTTVKVEENRKVSMRRFGTSSAEMTFEEGKCHETAYMTAYGDFKIEINTNSIVIDIEEDSKKGNIQISYDLKISGITETENQLKIQLM